MAKYICTNCGYDDKGKLKLRGSKGMEWFIWIAFLIPGPFYTLWRRVGVKRQCPNCHLHTIVKATSDAGWLAQKKFDLELGIIRPDSSKPQTLTETDQENKPRSERKIDPDAW